MRGELQDRSHAESQFQPPTVLSGRIFVAQNVVWADDAVFKRGRDLPRQRLARQINKVVGA